MKTIRTLFFGAFFGLLLMGYSGFAQEEKNYFITVTKFHWNMGMKDFNMDDWKAMEKEYLDKVVMKNPFIVGQEILMHYFTDDNTEVLLVTEYNNWEEIEKADEKDSELIKAAWPDEKKRKAFFEKRNAYYAMNHSDEIYSTLTGGKIPKAKFDKDMLYYVRVSHFAYPKNGSEKEFNDLRKQYTDAVINKNELIKAYYPHRHAWGADSTQFTEVFAVESLGDLEKVLDKNKELFKAAWKDDSKAKEFNEKLGKYFTGIHGDYIYKAVHELSK